MRFNGMPPARRNKARWHPHPPPSLPLQVLGTGLVVDSFFFFFFLGASSEGTVLICGLIAACLFILALPKIIAAFPLSLRVGVCHSCSALRENLVPFTRIAERIRTSSPSVRRRRHRAAGWNRSGKILAVAVGTLGTKGSDRRDSFSIRLRCHGASVAFNCSKYV